MMNTNIERKQKEKYSAYLKKIVVEYKNKLHFAFKIFLQEKMTYRASALTLSLLLSIVPIFALIFAIARGFGLDNYITKQINTIFRAQPQVSDFLLQFVDRYLTQIKGGIIVGFGILLLLYTIAMLINGIEETFNQIWQIKKGRNLKTQLSDYTCAIIFLPLFFILSSSLSLFFSESLGNLLNFIPFIPRLPFGWLLPYLVMIIFFLLFYLFLPNTKVPIKSAMKTAVPVGILIQLLMYSYIYMQKMMTGYNAVYGSLAAIPFIMLWMKIMWYIILFGATFCYADTHYEEKNMMDKESFNYLYACIKILTIIYYNFNNEKEKLREEDIAKYLGITLFSVRDIINFLKEKELLHNNDDEIYPSQSASSLTVGDFILQISHNSKKELICDTEFKCFITNVFDLDYSKQTFEVLEKRLKHDILNS